MSQDSGHGMCSALIEEIRSAWCAFSEEEDGRWETCLLYAGVGLVVWLWHTDITPLFQLCWSRMGRHSKFFPTTPLDGQVSRAAVGYRA